MQSAALFFFIFYFLFYYFLVQSMNHQWSAVTVVRSLLIAASAADKCSALRVNVSCGQVRTENAAVSAVRARSNDERPGGALAVFVSGSFFPLFLLLCCPYILGCLHGGHLLRWEAAARCSSSAELLKSCLLS